MLALEASRGELEVDYALFSDTQWEPTQIYSHLDWLETELAKADIPLLRCTKGDVRDMVKNRKEGKRGASIPAFIKKKEGGREGVLMRQCTREYKIEPLEKTIRYEIVGLKPRQWMPKDVHINVIMGISYDELTRCTMSKAKWKTHQYPLVDRKITRQDCIGWLKEHYPGRTFVRSACLGCPYRSNSEFAWVRDNDPEGWESVVAFDREIRNLFGEGESQLFLHRSCETIDEIELGEVENDSWLDECSGMCGN